METTTTPDQEPAAEATELDDQSVRDMRPDVTDFIVCEPSEVGSGYSILAYTEGGEEMLLASNVGQATANRIVTGVHEALRTWGPFR